MRLPRPASVLIQKERNQQELHRPQSSYIWSELLKAVSSCSYVRARGGTPLYKVYRYVPPQRVWFLSRFGLKTGIDFDNYGLKSGRVFGAGNIYESLQTYFSSQYVAGTTN